MYESNIKNRSIRIIFLKKSKKKYLEKTDGQVFGDNYFFS